MQFWELIPSITSPLAALCFIFYLFYLYKSREDEKIEKTLSVPNPTAQKKAADKILNEYRDIEIAKIENPEHAVEIAKQIINDKLIKYNKTANTLLLFTGIFAVTFLLSQLINSQNEQKDKETKNKDQSSWSIKEATKNNYPYATRTIIQHIRLNEVLDSVNLKKRVAEFRDFYTITATKDISKEDNIFTEHYYSSFVKVSPWAGSEMQQIQSINKDIYWVKFDLKKGDTKTIVTGANYYYTLPLSQTQKSGDCFNIDYSPDEWLTCYPNDIDYIDKLTILIESDNIDIKLPPISMYRKDKTGKIIEGEASTRVYLLKDTGEKKTLVATWDKIEPGECVGLKIKW